MKITSFTDDPKTLLPILEPVVREGRTYPVSRTATRAEILEYWFAPDKTVYAASDSEGRPIGTYYLKPNSTGPAAHVANAGYMVHPDARRQGVARAMVLDSFERARAEGYRAMQFNLVIASNSGAIALWRDVGMQDVGCLPGAFRMPDGSYADALVMYRAL